VVQCARCGAEVPSGSFCGNCGEHLAEPFRGSRFDSFAATPREHTAHLAVVSTLFPRLPERHAAVFREALGAALLATLVLGALRLYAPALLVAIVVLPALCVVYLYEVDAYESQPLRVIAATLVAGAALGFAYTFVLGRLVSPSLAGTRQGAFVTAVAVPVGAQILMLAGPLLLTRLREFDSVLDGLTFGVTSALGYTLSAVLTAYWHVLTGPLQGPATFTPESIANIVRVGILAALVNASTTGAISAAIWSRVRATSSGRHASAWRGTAATAAAGALAQVALGLVSYYVSSLTLVVAVWAVAAVALLLWLRILLHHALLDEGVAHAVGPPSICVRCHRVVPAMRFCPSCGAARAAAPKRAHEPMQSVPS